jgi:hypothetical protein
MITALHPRTFVNSLIPHWPDNQSTNKEVSVQDIVRLFGYSRKRSPRFFVQKNDGKIYFINQEFKMFEEWDKKDPDLEVLGEITSTSTHSVRLKDGTAFEMDEDIVWQIETLMLPEFLILATMYGVSFARPIPRSKYQDDPVVEEAETNHVRDRWGYSNPFLVPKKKDFYEDEERVYRQKPSRR